MAEQQHAREPRILTDTAVITSVGGYTRKEREKVQYSAGNEM